MILLWWAITRSILFVRVLLLCHYYDNDENLRYPLFLTELRWSLFGFIPVLGDFALLIRLFAVYAGDPTYSASRNLRGDVHAFMEGFFEELLRVFERGDTFIRFLVLFVLAVCGLLCAVLLQTFLELDLYLKPPQALKQDTCLDEDFRSQDEE